MRARNRQSIWLMLMILDKLPSRHRPTHIRNQTFKTRQVWHRLHTTASQSCVALMRQMSRPRYLHWPMRSTMARSMENVPCVVEMLGPIHDKTLQVRCLIVSFTLVTLKVSQGLQFRQHTCPLPTPHRPVTHIIPISRLADRMLVYIQRYGCLRLQRPHRHLVSNRIHHSIL